MISKQEFDRRVKVNARERFLSDLYQAQDSATKVRGAHVAHRGKAYDQNLRNDVEHELEVLRDCVYRIGDRSLVDAYYEYSEDLLAISGMPTPNELDEWDTRLRRSNNEIALSLRMVELIHSPEMRVTLEKDLLAPSSSSENNPSRKGSYSQSDQTDREGGNG